jgi:hypothetical protein
MALKLYNILTCIREGGGEIDNQSLINLLLTINELYKKSNPGC